MVNSGLPYCVAANFFCVWCGSSTHRASKLISRHSSPASKDAHPFKALDYSSHLISDTDVEEPRSFLASFTTVSFTLGFGECGTPTSRRIWISTPKFPVYMIIAVKILTFGSFYYVQPVVSEAFGAFSTVPPQTLPLRIPLWLLF